MEEGRLILITTYGRGPDHQYTWKNLPEHVRQDTQLVVSPDERKAFVVAGYPVVVCPKQGQGLGVVRQWCVDYAHNKGYVKLGLFDDDLVQWSRRGMTKTGDTYARCGAEEVGRAITRMWGHLDRYAHGGIPISLYAQGHDILEFNKRALDALFYRVDILKSGRYKFDMPLMSDFDMTLKLIKGGWANVIDYYCYQKQKGSNLPGGCSSYRTLDGMRAAAAELEMRYAPFVKVVTRPDNWGLKGERADVRVAWKKLAEASRATTIDGRA